MISFGHHLPGPGRRRARVSSISWSRGVASRTASRSSATYSGISANPIIIVARELNASPDDPSGDCGVFSPTRHLSLQAHYIHCR
jgi:hypothetical protein